MSKRLADIKNIHIDEATTHCMCVDVEDENGVAMDLTGCEAVFTAGAVEKACTISDNTISVELTPEETKGYLSSCYQIRLFNGNGEIMQIMQGIIYIRKAHRPYLQNPLKGE